MTPRQTTRTNDSTAWDGEVYDRGPDGAEGDEPDDGCDRARVQRLLLLVAASKTRARVALVRLLVLLLRSRVTLVGRAAEARTTRPSAATMRYSN